MGILLTGTPKFHWNYFLVLERDLETASRYLEFTPDNYKTYSIELARRLKVPTNRVTAILNGQRAISGDTALRLAHFFGTSPQFWLNLQSLYEIRLAEEKSGRAIKKLPSLKRVEEVHA